jgi:hypothetical protein
MLLTSSKNDFAFSEGTQSSYLEEVLDSNLCFSILLASRILVYVCLNGVAKSGKPCARFTPVPAFGRDRNCRVISLMTYSPNSTAFCDVRRGMASVFPTHAAWRMICAANRSISSFGGLH